MIKDIFYDGLFDYKNFIIKHIVDLNISPTEALVLSLLLEQYQNKETTIKTKRIAMKLNLHMQEVERALEVLLDKNFYNFYLKNDKNNLGVECFTCEPFLNKVEEFYNKNNEQVKENEKIFKLIEKKTKTLLTDKDYNIINELLIDYNYDDFERVLDYLEKSHFDLSVRNIAKYIKESKNNNKDIVNDFFKQIGFR